MHTKDRAGCEQAFRTAIDQFRQCNDLQLAEETERELAALTRKVGSPWWPWWVWLIIALLIFSLIYLARA